MCAGEEHSLGQPDVGDVVAVAVRDAAGEAAFFKAALVIGGLPGCDRAGLAAEVVGQQGAQVGVGEPAGLQPEDEHDVRQGLGAGVGEAQPGGAASSRRRLAEKPISHRAGRLVSRRPIEKS